MKLVQSFWSSQCNPENPLENNSGWLSPEFHWMSWALSCLQFSRLYAPPQLFTDKLEKKVLIDILRLPYGDVHVELDILNHYSPKLWALAKIYTYSLQTEPFIHIDGHIYIWERFDDKIYQAELIGQNVEIAVSFYYKSMSEVSQYFEYIPEPIKIVLGKDPVIRSCNTGVIGGSNLNIFKEYTTLALDFINKNIQHLDKIDIPTFNIVFEQLLYCCLAQMRNIPISYLIKEEEKFDANYYFFADFHKVPFQTKFIHAMADYKKNSVVCQHLAKRLRQDFPEFYYRIISSCQENNIVLYNNVYQLKEFSPCIHDVEYFLNLKRGFIQGTLIPASWQYFYGKDMATYEFIEKLYSLSFSDILQKEIIFDSDAKIIEKKNSSEIKQTLKIINVQKLVNEFYELDSLNIILYNAILEKKYIFKVIEEISLYFTNEEVERDKQKFIDLILSRIKQSMYLGSIRWVH